MTTSHTIQQFPDWPVVSQDRESIDPDLVQKMEKQVLPGLIRVWQRIEQATGYRWHSTSYWRKSPSHQYGYALDIAPDIAPGDKNKYAVFQGSDPVLYKREKLMRTLQSLKHEKFFNNWYVGLFVEPDHIHIQLLQKDNGMPTRVFKWGIVKPLYGDSSKRAQLPLIQQKS